MKRILTALLAAALCLSLLCACGGDKQTESGASSQGNAAPFNMDVGHLNGVLSGEWVNQNDLNDTITFSDDLGFTHTVGGTAHSGTAKLDEKGGLLTLTYGDGFSPEKAYVWVDSKSQINANTWYVDGGTFAFGGTVYIKGGAG